MHVSQNQSRIPSKRKQHENFSRRDFTACEREKCKTADFSNPCNPTSLGIGRDDIIKIIEGTDALVIVDEAYMEFEMKVIPS